ncbi:hypothetical protein TWF694_011498 [Orbilia ellipsospora]|uniref:Uncharacterized protein n=1 Tax=Orbilia ellipsospora TaxID=2528407 RepID=A0AAV9X6S2_9PEZI
MRSSVLLHSFLLTLAVRVSAAPAKPPPTRETVTNNSVNPIVDGATKPFQEFSTTFGQTTNEGMPTVIFGGSKSETVTVTRGEGATPFTANFGPAQCCKNAAEVTKSKAKCIPAACGLSIKSMKGSETISESTFKSTTKDGKFKLEKFTINSVSKKFKPTLEQMKTLNANARRFKYAVDALKKMHAKPKRLPRVRRQETTTETETVETTTTTTESSSSGESSSGGTVTNGIIADPTGSQDAERWFNTFLIVLIKILQDFIVEVDTYPWANLDAKSVGFLATLSFNTATRFEQFFLGAFTNGQFVDESFTQSFNDFSTAVLTLSSKVSSSIDVNKVSTAAESFDVNGIMSSVSSFDVEGITADAIKIGMDAITSSTKIPGIDGVTGGFGGLGGGIVPTDVEGATHPANIIAGGINGIPNGGATNIISGGTANIVGGDGIGSIMGGGVDTVTGGGETGTISNGGVDTIINSGAGTIMNGANPDTIFGEGNIDGVIPSDTTNTIFPGGTETTANGGIGNIIPTDGNTETVTGGGLTGIIPTGGNVGNLNGGVAGIIPTGDNTGTVVTGIFPTGGNSDTVITSTDPNTVVEPVSGSTANTIIDNATNSGTVTGGTVGTVSGGTVNTIVDNATNPSAVTGTGNIVGTVTNGGSVNGITGTDTTGVPHLTTSNGVISITNSFPGFNGVTSAVGGTGSADTFTTAFTSAFTTFSGTITQFFPMFDIPTDGVTSFVFTSSPEN